LTNKAGNVRAEADFEDVTNQIESAVT